MSSPEPLILGPFRLDSPFAAGGMGEIWRGEHLGQGVPVAVKVMVADELQSQVFRRAFRNEAWAMARLDHRGVVMVYDQGVVPEDVAARSEGRLQAGSPYLVMDFVGGGTLLDAPPTTWWELKRTLLLLLDALAHAHARGVVHRDLKPANILLDPDTETSGGLQLTDFGISHAIERALPQEEGAAPVMGTMHYMAPEQLDGRWRDYGPWTDLYSLGCIAWELACGHLPFEADDPLDLMDLHLDEPPPPLEPRFAVPDGFAEWVATLLEKEPFARPARAADAARTLKELGEPEESEFTRALGLTMVDGLKAVKPDELDQLLSASMRKDSNELGLQTLSQIAPVAPPATWDDDDVSTEFEDSALQAAARLGLSWRRHRRPREWKRLAGAGLGLWGLRQAPLVGRDEVVDGIWDALRAVTRENQARLVLLDGPLGAGTSRVALWLCERAHELGVAHVLWATHGPTDGPTDGLGRMLAREFRVQGLSPAMREDRVADVLLRQDLVSEDKADAMAADLDRWMDEHRGSPVPSAATARTSEEERPRFKHLYRYLRRLSRRRPVVLWLDDAQWGLEALAFAWYVLRAQEQKPGDVLVLLSLQGEAVEDDDVAALLSSIARHPASNLVRMQGLGARDQAHLLRDLGLDGELALRLAESSEGNPLYATELVGDWVRRQVLVPGEDGFVLREGADATVPEDLPALWANRVERALEGLPTEARRAMEVAAAMGGRVQRAAFQEACRILGFVPPTGLVERLYRERLAVPSKGGWSFVHEALRTAVEREAREEERWIDVRAAVRATRRRRVAGDQTTDVVKVQAG